MEVFDLNFCHIRVVILSSSTLYESLLFYWNTLEEICSNEVQSEVRMFISSLNTPHSKRKLCGCQNTFFNASNIQVNIFGDDDDEATPRKKVKKAVLEAVSVADGMDDSSLSSSSDAKVPAASTLTEPIIPSQTSFASEMCAVCQ